MGAVLVSVSLVTVRTLGAGGVVAATVEALGRRLIRLLAAAVADPERALGALPILEPAERDTILRRWNDTAQPTEPTTLPELFAAQALRTPAAAAVMFEDRVLSYAELDAHANRLAHHLQSLGVGPETMVGLCVERSPEMVVGLLGILKAGGAYLPLDPNYPRERLAFMLADAGAVIKGRVTSVLNFGAFVDLGGGIQGLLHVSEMGWSRVTSPGEIVAAGLKHLHQGLRDAVADDDGTVGPGSPHHG